MLNSIRASIKDTFIFGFGNIAVKVVGFVLIPLYTNPSYFSVDDFGIIGILDISGLVLLSIMGSSLPQSLTRWYWAKEQPNKQKEIFFMTFISQVVMSLLFCFIFLPLSGNLSELVFKNRDWNLAIIFLIISSALQGINNINNTLLRLQSRSFLFTITNLIKLLIVLIITIYLIVFVKMGVAGIYLSQVIGNFLLIIFLIPFTSKNCRARIDTKTWKSMMSYGLPLIIASFSAVLLNVIDRYALNSLTLLKYVAIYTLAFKISSSLKLVLVDAVKLAIFPRMIRRIDSPDNKRFYSKAMLYTSFIVMFGIIGVSLFSLELIKFLAKTAELWSAFMLVPILSLATFFLNMREVSIYGLIVTKRTHKISIIVTIATILNLILNLWLIPIWNAMGAAIATLISQMFYWSIIHYVAQKEYFIPYEGRKILMIFVTGTILSFAGLLLINMGLITRLLIKSACLLSFPLILYFIKFYEDVELKAIKGFIVKWSNLGNLRGNIKSLNTISDDF